MTKRAAQWGLTSFGILNVSDPLLHCLEGRDAPRAVVGFHSQVPGLGRQVPGSGVQHQVQVQDPHPYPHPYPYPNLITRT